MLVHSKTNKTKQNNNTNNKEHQQQTAEEKLREWGLVSLEKSAPRVARHHPSGAYKEATKEPNSLQWRIAEVQGE